MILKSGEKNARTWNYTQFYASGSSSFSFQECKKVFDSDLLASMCGGVRNRMYVFDLYLVPFWKKGITPTSSTDFKVMSKLGVSGKTKDK